MPPPYKKKPIEVALPLEAIDAAAMRERLLAAIVRAGGAGAPPYRRRILQARAGLRQKAIESGSARLLKQAEVRG